MSFWLGIDERFDEPIHQYEPHYNKLHGKWKSTCHSYVSSGMAKSIIPEKHYMEAFELLKAKKRKALLFEIDGFDVENKARVLNITKIH